MYQPQYSGAAATASPRQLQGISGPWIHVHVNLHHLPLSSINVAFQAGLCRPSSEIWLMAHRPGQTPFHGHSASGSALSLRGVYKVERLCTSPLHCGEVHSVT